jgi:NAD(P)-dependent dehydrogenase (short-subunit alcohol dehydrogenase family)
MVKYPKFWKGKMMNSVGIKKKLIVITGATSGIGQAAMKSLADEGHAVIGVARNAQKALFAKQALLASYPHADIDYIYADLSAQAHVRGLAEEIQKKIVLRGFLGLDVLVNNAGAVSSWFTITEDGYEMQFAVNHLAPFLLSYLLLPNLRNCEGSRILTVSSSSHRNTRIHWKDVMLRKNYGTLRAYKQSKLANVLFTYEFNRLNTSDSDIRAYAVDPGLVNTTIGAKRTNGLSNRFWNRRRHKGVSSELAAETIVYLAMRQHLPAATSWYWKACGPEQPSRHAQSEESAGRLWDLSTRLCGLV